MHLELTPEQIAFKQTVDRFADQRVRPRAAAIDESGAFPLDLLREAGQHGLCGVTIPKALGGAGRDYISYAVAIESVGRASATVAVALTVCNSLVTEVIARFGSEVQKQRWVPRIAGGQAFGSFALSEPEAGTDAANQHTTARREPGGYHIIGDKVWVALAEAAEMVILFAATRPNEADRGTTAFLVPMETPGIARTARNDSLGVRGLGCVDLGFDIHVTDDQVLGEVGSGFRMARWALDGGRVAIAAQALGVGQAALDEALEYARKRVTFGQTIGTYQAVQWKLADTATELDAARMLTLKAAAAHDRQERSSMEASMAKLYASESAHRAADNAMQILASAGYRRGSTVERLFRDVRAAEIYQGTSEVQRMIIADAILK